MPFPQDSFWLSNLIYAGNVLLAAFCGALIGMERKSRLKEAGLRTHIIVAVAASVMTIISKYGFYGVLSETVRLDPSRIGAGVVAAVSFLGAGMIFMRGDAIFGLTTAAGLWATVGVGMAAGSGMYLLAIFATLLILCLQIFTHRYSRLERTDVGQHLLLRVAHTDRAIGLVKDLLEQHRIEVLSIRAARVENGIAEIEAAIKCPAGYEPARLLEWLDAEPALLSVEL